MTVCSLRTIWFKNEFRYITSRYFEITVMKKHETTSMLETEYISESFEILVTVSLVFITNILFLWHNFQVLTPQQYHLDIDSVTNTIVCFLSNLLVTC